MDRAHTVFLSGKQYLEESNYDKAISYFKDAYSIDCSVHPILPIIATAYERKGDKPAAIRALQEYIKRSPNAPDREVVERRIRNLSDQLSREPPAPVVAPAPPPPATPSPPSVASEPQAAPPPTPAHAEEPATPTDRRSIAPWIVVGAGGVAAISGVILLATGSSDVSSASSACPGRQNCPSDVASKGNTGRSLITTGLVVGGFGVAAAVGGLIWYALEPPPVAAGHARTAWPSVAVAPGLATVTLDGTF